MRIVNREAYSGARNGVTLIETLVGTILSSTVLLMLFGFSWFHGRHMSAEHSFAQVVQEGQRLVHRMRADLRSLVVGESSPRIDRDGTRLSIDVGLADGVRPVTYSIDASSGTISRQQSGDTLSFGCGQFVDARVSWDAPGGTLVFSFRAQSLARRVAPINFAESFRIPSVTQGRAYAFWGGRVR